MTTNRELNPDRYQTIAREVYEFLSASDYADDFDADAITAAVAAVANSVDDLSMDEFNAILEANAR